MEVPVLYILDRIFLMCRVIVWVVQSCTVLGGHVGSQPQGTTSSKSERFCFQHVACSSWELQEAGGQSWMLTKGGCSGKAHLPRLSWAQGTWAKSQFCPKFSLGDSAGCYQHRGVETTAPSCPRRRWPLLQDVILQDNPQVSFRLCSPTPQPSLLLFVTENSARSFSFQRTAQQFFKAFGSQRGAGAAPGWWHRARGAQWMRVLGQILPWRILEAELVCSSRSKQICSALENLPQEQGWNKHKVKWVAWSDCCLNTGKGGIVPGLRCCRARLPPKPGADVFLLLPSHHSEPSVCCKQIAASLTHPNPSL